MNGEAPLHSVAAGLLPAVEPIPSARSLAGTSCTKKSEQSVLVDECNKWLSRRFSPPPVVEIWSVCKKIETYPALFIRAGCA